MPTKLFKKYTAIILTCVIILSVLAPLSVTHAAYSDDVEKNFQKGVIACAATAAVTFLLSFLGGMSVPTSDIPQFVKEQIMDCLFWAFKNAVIQMVTGETVQWVQGGMGGNPAFVQNIRQYLRSVADNAAGSFIEGAAPFLCSPFRDEIINQLKEYYRNQSGKGLYADRASCTLSDVVDNVNDMNAFLNGDFYAGGWDGWLELHNNPYNHPYGAYIEASQELDLRVQSAAREAGKKIDLGQGFLSKETQTCYAYPADSEGNKSSDTPVGSYETGSGGHTFDGEVVIECDPPQIITPGTEIKNSLEKAFDVNLDQIAGADEFDEIFNLFAAYITAKILTGDEGLAGYDKDDFDYDSPDIDDGGELPGGGGPTSPNDTEPAGPPGPSTCFVKNGDFFTPAPGDETRRVHFPLPQNVSYDQITLDLDVKNGGWAAEAPSDTHEIFWLVRDKNRNMFGYAFVHGPSTNNVTIRNGVGQTHVLKAKKSTKMTFPEGATYHFNYVYDAKADTIQLKVTDNGKTVATLSSVPDVPGINVGNEKFLVDFGFPTTAESGNPLEEPTYGWDYSNLKVQFLSSGDAPGACTEAPTQAFPSDGTGDRGEEGPLKPESEV